MFKNHFLQLALRLPLWCLMVVTALLIFVPFSPSMPSGLNPLDPSWVFGMNFAASQKFLIGKELLFTYGPYAAVFTKTYHPFTDHYALYGSIYLAITYSIAIIFITRKSSVLWMLILIAAFSFIRNYTDALLSSYALIMGIFCYQIASIEINSKKVYAWLLVSIFLLFTPFGLYPLIKGSIYVLYFFVALLSIGLFVFYRRLLFAAIIPISIVISLIFFWKLIGQPVSGLVEYFSSLGIIISGYSDAMSINGNKFEIFAYLFTSCILMLAFLRGRDLKINTIYMAIIFAIYLFISFKGGFVRHDGHAVYGVAALYLTAVILFASFPSASSFVALIAASITFLYIDGHYDNALRARRFAPVLETYKWGIYGANKRFDKDTQLILDYEKALNEIKSQSNFPNLIGSVDTYPFDQSKIIAAGYQWRPRPVFQSYAAYNPQLAKINNEFLLTEKSPDNIVFRVFTIDGRYPTLDDGMSWPTILSNYTLSEAKGEFLFLKKRHPRNQSAQFCDLGTEVYGFGQDISIPSLNTLIFAKIEVRPNLLGRIMNLIYKNSQLRIYVHLNNGQTKSYRIVPGMAEAGFVLSPLVENTSDFKQLIFDRDLTSLNRVKSFSVAPIEQAWQWENSVRVNLKEVNLNSAMKLPCK